MIKGRALHYVFKIGERAKSIAFYKDVLGMKVLRHEEFKAGCEAQCNGPYDGAWSKTMIGYGDEDHHFVIELTYNYGIGNYIHGNDFKAITINNPNVYVKILNGLWPFEKSSDYQLTVISPCGYKFLINNSEPKDIDPVSSCTLSSSNIENTKKFWSGLLKMNIISENNEHISMVYDSSQCALNFEQLVQPIDHARAYGRIAFATATSNLESIEKLIRDNGHTILKPYTGLDTPGKSRVYVVILADPDGHEICFVGDEAFKELSKVDPEAEKLLDDAITKDKSEEWFNKRGGKSTE